MKKMLIDHQKLHGGKISSDNLGTFSSWLFPVSRVLLPMVFVCCGVGLIEGAPAISIVPIILFVLGYQAMNLTSSDRIDRQYLHAFFMWGFFIRVVYCVVLYYWLVALKGDAFLGDYTDDREYDMAGQLLLDLWKHHDFQIPAYMRNHPGYNIFIGVIRYVGESMGGFHPLLPRFINVFIGTLIAPYTYILAKNLFDRKIAVLTGLIVMLYPGFVFYSSVQLRDIIIVFLFVYSISQLSRYIILEETSGLILAFLAVPPIFYLRSIYALVLSGSLFITLMGHIKYQKKKIIPYRSMKLIALFFGVIFLLGYMIAAGKSNSAIAPELRVLDVNVLVSSIFHRRQHSLSVASSTSIAGALLGKVPFGLGIFVLPLVMFIMPYPPWLLLFEPDQLSVINFINALFWTLLMPLSFLGLVKTIKQRFPENLLLLVPMLFILIAAGTGNFTDRYKLEAIPFALIFAAIGIYMIAKEKNNKNQKYYLLMQGGLLLAYVIVKYVIM